MATDTNTGGIRPVTLPNHFPPAAAALIAARLLNKHSPGEIAEAVEILVDVLDLIGGDPDLDDDDDREPDDDAQGDTSWTEWQSRGRHKDNPGVICTDGRQCQEDMEDDDPDTGVEDNPLGFDPETDSGADDFDEEIGRMAVPQYGIDQTKGPINEAAANRAYLARENGLVPNGRGGWRVPS